MFELNIPSVHRVSPVLCGPASTAGGTRLKAAWKPEAESEARAVLRCEALGCAGALYCSVLVCLVLLCLGVVWCCLVICHSIMAVPQCGVVWCGVGVRLQSAYVFPTSGGGLVGCSHAVSSVG